MPLVSMIEMMQRAQAGGYAVPCFDTFEMLGTQGIVDALEAKEAPGIIGLYTRLMEEPHGRAVTAFVRALAEDSAVPIAVILDHGASHEHCERALDWGFTDVMIDGSRLPLAENIATTRRVAETAHAAGAGVEAELGHVGSGKDYAREAGQGLTDPEEAVRFVAETGVDTLAVAVGTAHGLYDGEPKLALDRLAALRDRLDVPLVLHGGSGLSDDQYRAAIARGIAKINIFTNLAIEAAARTRAAAQNPDSSLHALTAQIREGFRVECERLLDVFGATGQASA